MKKPQGRPSKYPIELRKFIAEKVAAGQMTYREAAVKYNISHGAIGQWKKRHASGTLGNMLPPPAPEEESKQLEGLKLENQMLKQELGGLMLENRVLKKAADWVQAVRNESSSIITPETLIQSMSKADAK